MPIPLLQRPRLASLLWLLVVPTVVLAVLLRIGWSLLQQQPPSVRLGHDWNAITGKVAKDRKIALQLVAEGFAQPTDIQFIPGVAGVAVVLEKPGRAVLWTRAAPVARPGAAVLKVAVRNAPEMGLLGLAFHPRFAQNGLFYLNYTPLEGERRTRIAEWKATPGSALADAREQRVLLEVSQPYDNHNGGALAFGPDGQLYIALGDGGSGGDPHGHGQNRKSLLGKILRIDPLPSPSLPYTIPPDNPFVKDLSFRPEIWAYGLRNPWRIAFAAQGRLLTGDVGQNLYEEIDLVAGGDNLGWKIREGGHCFAAEQCQTAGLVEPIFEYPRSLGTSVTGGVIYRGAAVPSLREKYLFADFGGGRLWALEVPSESGGAYAVADELGQWDMQFSTFGQDPDGEVFVADFHVGKIYRIGPR